MDKRGETTPGRGRLRLCQKCQQRPAEYQGEGWLPMCRPCSDIICDLPADEMQEEMANQWRKYLDRDLGLPDLSTLRDRVSKFFKARGN